MLRQLHLQNFALLEKQLINFGAGLNVISGETGAGKSIILQALELLLGGRPRAQFIRSGAEEFEIEALFDLRALPEDKRNALPEVARGDDLLLARSWSVSGRGRVLINGRLGSVALLEELAGRLMNICRQGHKVMLLEDGYHLALVDDFAANAELRERYVAEFEVYSRLDATLRDFDEASRRNALRSAELEFLVEELAALDLRAGLRTELEGEISRMSNSEKLAEHAGIVCSALEDEDGVMVRLAQIERELAEISRLGAVSDDIQGELRSAAALLDNAARSVRQRFGSAETDPEQLEALRSRLADLARIERKYRCDEAGLLALLSDAQRELQALGPGGSREQLVQQLAQSRQRLARLAADLTSTRRKAADRLQRLVESELGELNMPGARFKVDFTQHDFSKSGTESAAFSVAPNRGEGFKPLAQVASGGELSRIMLVLKKILRDRSGVNVLVFDEVDTGVSGKVARAVGEKLRELAGASQVICITHLPQVASLADHHFRVDKLSGARRTTSVVKELDSEEKVEEIARMLAGRDVTEAARQSARELIGD